MSENTLAKRESLRCLLASVASLDALDWIFIERGINWELVDTREIDQRLQSIRAWFVQGILPESEIQKHMPMMGPFLDQLMQVLFADAVRWWAAAHYSRPEPNKFLRQNMYKGDEATLYDHFYHWFRNNQLAHFPGGKESNDHTAWVPTPYLFPLTWAEHDDFKRLLVNSIKLTLGEHTNWPDLNQLSQNFSRIEGVGRSTNAAGTVRVGIGPGKSSSRPGRATNTGLGHSDATDGTPVMTLTAPAPTSFGSKLTSVTVNAYLANTRHWGSATPQWKGEAIPLQARSTQVGLQVKRIHARRHSDQFPPGRVPSST